MAVALTATSAAVSHHAIHAIHTRRTAPPTSQAPSSGGFVRLPRLSAIATAAFFVVSRLSAEAQEKKPYILEPQTPEQK
jgi:hypothetical protein